MAPDTAHQGKMAALPPIDPFIPFTPYAKKYLDLSPSTSDRLIVSHDVPIVRIGKKRLMRHSKFIALMDRIERESAVAA